MTLFGFNKLKAKPVDVKYTDSISDINQHITHFSEICHRQDKQLAEHAGKIAALQYRMHEMEQMHRLNQTHGKWDQSWLYKWLQRISHKGTRNESGSSNWGKGL